MHPTRTLSEIERTTGGLNRLYVPNRENTALPILTGYEYRQALKTRAVAYGVYFVWEHTVSDTRKMIARKYFARDKEPDNPSLNACCPESNCAAWADEARRVMAKWEEIYFSNEPSEEQILAAIFTNLTPAEQAAQLDREARALKTRQAIREGTARPLTGGDSSDLTTQPDMFAESVPTQYPLFDRV